MQTQSTAAPAPRPLIACPFCGGSMHLLRAMPDVQDKQIDIRQFGCACGTEVSDRVERH